jgi:hypothetical protein
VQDREKIVELIRVDTMKIADHRRMFEFFNDIKLRIKVAAVALGTGIACDCASTVADADCWVVLTARVRPVGRLARRRSDH